VVKLLLSCQVNLLFCCMKFVKQYLLKHYICLATTYADNAALSAFARCCCSNRSISPAGRAHSSKPAAAACGGREDRQTDRQTGGRMDRQTDARQFSTMRAVQITCLSNGPTKVCPLNRISIGSSVFVQIMCA